MFVCLIDLSFATQLIEEKSKTIQTVTASAATGIRDIISHTHRRSYAFIPTMCECVCVCVKISAVIPP